MITALVGGQFGSEGKGLVAGHIAAAHKHHIRVGAANAGHTVYTMIEPSWAQNHRPGDPIPDPFEKHVMQQIPCGAYTNPEADLYIGPGALISWEIMEEELMKLAQWRLNNGLREPHVYVDYRAQVIGETHIEEELKSGLALRIGSTSATAREGIGAAQAARVMRRADCVLARDFVPLVEAPFLKLANVPVLLAMLTKNEGNRILAEGTQGFGLSLTTGDFPFVTSRNTTAAGLLADCGLAPKRLDRVITVFRTYPIRVAGNSGPFHPESEEISWADLGVDPENERTTVTKKVRRVATFSYSQAWEACKVNGTTEIALTFCDYIDPEIAFLSGDWARHAGALDCFPKVLQMVDQLEYETEVRVRMLGTGPTSVVNLIH